MHTKPSKRLFKELHYFNALAEFMRSTFKSRHRHTHAEELFYCRSILQKYILCYLQFEVGYQEDSPKFLYCPFIRMIARIFDQLNQNQS